MGCSFRKSTVCLYLPKHHRLLLMLVQILSLLNYILFEPYSFSTFKLHAI